VLHGYKENDPYIQRFWEIVKSFKNEQKEKLLAFATGSNRPPLLGFKYMQPHFAIYRVSVDHAGDLRYPTASTCMNMLKLPHYGDPNKLKEILEYAINSEAGFNLD